MSDPWIGVHLCNYWVFPALYTWGEASTSLNGVPAISSKSKLRLRTSHSVAGVGSPYITICADRLLAVSTLQHTREARLARATRRSVLHTAIAAILGYTSIPDMVIRLQHILIWDESFPTALNRSRPRGGSPNSQHGARCIFTMVVRALTCVLLLLLSTIWIGTAVGSNATNAGACPDYASYSKHPQYVPRALVALTAVDLSSLMLCPATPSVTGRAAFRSRDPLRSAGHFAPMPSRTSSTISRQRWEIPTSRAYSRTLFLPRRTRLSSSTQMVTRSNSWTLGSAASETMGSGKARSRSSSLGT